MLLQVLNVLAGNKIDLAVPVGVKDFKLSELLSLKVVENEIIGD